MKESCGEFCNCCNTFCCFWKELFCERRGWHFLSCLWHTLQLSSEITSFVESKTINTMHILKANVDGSISAKLYYATAWCVSKQNKAEEPQLHSSLLISKHFPYKDDNLNLSMDLLPAWPPKASFTAHSCHQGLLQRAQLTHCVCCSEQSQLTAVTSSIGTGFEKWQC